MKFQGSGFNLDLPPGVIDSSCYVFSFPELGELPPNLSIRFEHGEAVDMKGRRKAQAARLRDSLPNVAFRTEDQVRSRGDWEYFTHTVEYGEDTARMCLKELHLRISQPQPTVYVFSGTDLSANWQSFEPTFDALVRSFQPNDIQRLS